MIDPYTQHANMIYVFIHTYMQTRALHYTMHTHAHTLALCNRFIIYVIIVHCTIMLFIVHIFIKS